MGAEFLDDLELWAEQHNSQTDFWHPNFDAMHEKKASFSKMMMSGHIHKKIEILLLVYKCSSQCVFKMGKIVHYDI